MDNKNEHDEAIRVLVEQYRKNMKMLIQEGQFNHRTLEQHLSFVIGTVNEEIKKITEDLIEEVEIEKKTAPARSAGKKPGSMRKRRK